MISGINGQLAATQSNSEPPVLQLTNLHGDTIATAYISETAGGLASTADTTEYGVPTTNLPPKYSWLGTLQLPTELPSGIIAMGTRSYVPQIGRFLQDDPIPGGSANAYTYTYGDPINTNDPTGAYVPTPNWLISFATEHALAATLRAEEEARRAAEEAAAQIAAEREAQRAQTIAAETAGPAFAYGEEETWGEEEEYEEGGYEEAAYHHGDKAGPEEAHTEGGVLYQPLGGEGRALPDATTQLCKPGLEGPCTHLVNGAENGYCLSRIRHHRLPGRCVKNAAWQKAMGKREKPAGPVEKCLFGAATYGLVGLVFDVVSPEGAAATCVLSTLSP